MPGQGADLFQHGTLLADDDTLVAGLFAVDGGIHIHHAGIPLGEFGDLHSGAVRDLFIQAEKQLLPDDLPHHLPLRLVAGLAVREQLGPLLGVLAQLVHQIVQPAAGMGGDGDDGVKAAPDLVIGGDHRQQRGGLHGVDLVDAEDTGNFFLLNALDQSLLRAAHMGDGLHQQQRAVHVGEAGGDDLDHIVPQSRLGLVEAGSVQQDILGVLPVHHTVDPVPGGLGLVGDDGDLLPHQRIGEAGLAHIGPAADGDHSNVFDVRHR